MTNNQLTSTHLAVKSELDGYKIHASRGQATAMAMVRLFESIDRDLEELQERRKADSEPVGTLSVRAMSYNGKKIGTQVGFVHSDAAMKIAEGDYPLYRHAQQPVVDADDNFYSWFGREWAENYQHNQYTTAAKQMLGVMAESAWKAGRRAAMLQELKKSAGTEAICRSDENVQVLHTKSPAQSDCCPAQNDVAPAQSPIYHGYLPECECSGCKATSRICAELAGNSPVIPDKWIPVSERMPDKNAEQQVLACFKGGDISTLYYFEGRWDDAYGIVPIRQDVTHWMPLPAAPQEVK